MRQPGIESHPNPAGGYSEAAERIAVLQSRDGPEINPESFTAWMDQGRKVEHAIVLLHGYTNSPKGFLTLGKEFYKLGYNVLIPREPHHGLRDRMTPVHAKLTAAGLARLTDDVVDIARGLGEKVTLFGISMSGAMTAWAAQNRDDIHLAAMVSPAIGFRAIPRYASRALANILYLSRTVLAQARQSPPRAREVLVMTNPSDRSVDNILIDELANAWLAAGAKNVRTYAFEAQDRIIHDFIDPDQPGGQVDLVYPILKEQLKNRGIGE